MPKGSMKEVYMESVIEQVAERGLENLRIKNIAIKGNRCEANIYNYFKGKDELLSAAYVYTDSDVSMKLKSAIEEHEGAPFGEMVYTIWAVFFDYFVQNPDRTIFMMRMRHSSYFTENLRNSRVIFSDEFAEIYSDFKERYEMFDYISPDKLVDYIYENALSNVEKLLIAGSEFDERARDIIGELVGGAVQNLYQCYVAGSVSSAS